MSIHIVRCSEQARQQLYDDLSKRSKHIINFPPFVNTDGPKEIEKAVEFFEEHYDNTLPLSDEKNQDVCRNVLHILEEFSPEDGFFYSAEDKTEDELRVLTACALLKFMLNDYKGALDDAEDAYYKGSIDIEYRSLPLFIRAVSSLVVYKGVSLSRFTYIVKQSLMDFESVIDYERDTKMIPVLYSIYISRLGLVDMQDYFTLSRIAKTIHKIEDDDSRTVVKLLLAVSFFFIDKASTIKNICSP